MRTQTLSILISDLQGYTERQARSSRAAIAADLERYAALLRAIFAAFDGELVKSMGEAFLVCFDSPTNAVLAAIQVQKRLELHNQALPEGEAPMRVRIGIATGEVSRDDAGDVFGDPVNLAARLQSSADSSAIWLAETTFLSMNKNEVQALEVGARVFKGVPGEVKVYRVLDTCIASARALTEADLERRLTPLKRDATRSRRVAFTALAVALGVASAVAAAFFFVQGPRDELSAETRFGADMHDVASGDAWMDELATQVYDADEGELQRLYREETIEAHLQRARPALRGRPSFVRARLVWDMASAPLQDGLAEAVQESVARHALLRADPRFMKLLRDTVDYALRDEERHAAYQRALAAAEVRRPLRCGAQILNAGSRSVPTTAPMRAERPGAMTGAIGPPIHAAAAIPKTRPAITHTNTPSPRRCTTHPSARPSANAARSGLGAKPVNMSWTPSACNADARSVSRSRQSSTPWIRASSASSSASL